MSVLHTDLSRIAVRVLLVWWSLLSVVRADDITTLSGQTLRDVQVARVEPDGVTWAHATGVAKVDFTDLPEAVRKEFHYDAGKAAAYAAAQAKAREEAEARVQQTQREAEAHRTQRYQAQAVGLESKPGELAVRRRAEQEPTVRSMGEEMVAKKEAEAFRTKDDGTMWDRRLWAVPKYIFGGNEFDGVAFDPKTDFNSHEFKASLHHSPGGFAPDAAHDAFFQPDYMTKSYNDGIDRAAAFAQGRP